MKSVIVGVLFSMILSGFCNAQSLYSRQNLSQASSVTLEILFSNAKGLRQKGAIVSILGPVSFGFGFATAGSGLLTDQSAVNAGVVLMSAGCVMILIGIPIIIIGSSRVKRIKSYMPGLTNMSFAKLTPCTINYNQGNKVCPGLKFTITF